MSREAGLMIVLGVALIALALMWWGWRGRARRDAALPVPFGAFSVTPDTASFAGLYVATTAHNDPLNRLALPGLAFRATTRLAVDDPGVMIDSAGTKPILIPADAIDTVERATFTIDRVVERDGLVKIVWSLTPDMLVDSYFRLQDADPEALLATIRPHLTHATGNPA